MTTSDYITRRYGSNRNRHWWGIAHRARLISTGEYIRTSDRGREGRRKGRITPVEWFVGEPGPELVHFRSDHG